MTKMGQGKMTGFVGFLASSFWQRPIAPLLLILLIAGIFRLAGPGSPPGLNQDEASNAWNAYCLLETGRDQHGDRWPIFYSRCLGGYRSTLYLYLLMPFQAIGGLGVWTTRLPSAIAGIVTVGLIYYVGSQMFGRKIGLVSAALLAVSPWHVYQSRWGHEAAICPLLVMLPLAAMLWANLPLDGRKRRPRIIPAALAGIIMGICCYGYPAVRIFLPTFLLLALIVTWRAWWNVLKDRRGSLALAFFAVGLAVTLGPLTWKHFTDREHISKRLSMTCLWQPTDPLGEKAKYFLTRYPSHFGPEYLFVFGGDPIIFHSPPGTGQFHWYMLPLMVAGIIGTVKRFRSWPAVRILLVMVLVYPVSDCISWHSMDGKEQVMHTLRSMPGLCGLVFLGAAGAVWIWDWLHQKRLSTRSVVFNVLGAMMVGLNCYFLTCVFYAYNKFPVVYRRYNVDLLEACDWLQPRFDQVDAVFCTTHDTIMPYAIVMVGMNYEPEQWFRDVRQMHEEGGWDLYTQVGKFYFMYEDSHQPALERLKANDRDDRVIFITRPGETEFSKPPMHEIRDPDGQVTLCIYDYIL